MKVDFEKVTRFPKWICSHCGEYPEGKFEVLDRNACTLDVGSADFAKRSDFLFWDLLCPCCNRVSYLFELTLREESDSEIQFIADGCWTVSERSKFVAHGDTLQWEYEHLQGIDFYDGGKADWIGVHCFGPFADFNIGKMRVTHLIAEVCDLAEKQKGA